MLQIDHILFFSLYEKKNNASENKSRLNLRDLPIFSPLTLNALFHKLSMAAMNVFR